MEKHKLGEAIEALIIPIVFVMSYHIYCFQEKSTTGTLSYETCRKNMICHYNKEVAFGALVWRFPVDCGSSVAVG